jgi:hypothetical protein
VDARTTVHAAEIVSIVWPGNSHLGQGPRHTRPELWSPLFLLLSALPSPLLILPLLLLSLRSPGRGLAECWQSQGRGHVPKGEC